MTKNDQNILPIEQLLSLYLLTLEGESAHRNFPRYLQEYFKLNYIQTNLQISHISVQNYFNHLDKKEDSEERKHAAGTALRSFAGWLDENDYLSTSLEKIRKICKSNLSGTITRVYNYKEIDFNEIIRIAEKDLRTLSALWLIALTTATSKQLISLTIKDLHFIDGSLSLTKAYSEETIDIKISRAGSCVILNYLTQTNRDLKSQGPILIQKDIQKLLN